VFPTTPLERRLIVDGTYPKASEAVQPCRYLRGTICQVALVAEGRPLLLECAREVMQSLAIAPETCQRAGSAGKRGNLSSDRGRHPLDLRAPVDRGCAIRPEERDKLGSPFGRRPPRPPQFGTATPASERICVRRSFRGGKLDVSHRVVYSSGRCAPRSG